ncbi:hypothetical protein ACQCT3_00785 [Sutcliffiella horikoshii]|uniref:hypothetical protein n=1 Tax=Sutcliffiella horikoshii TaxID=79883 RepID=UPI003CEA6075
MKWEKCRRCGSNRVVKRSALGIGLFLIFISLMLYGIGSTLNDRITAMLLPTLGLAIIGILLSFFSGGLVCKDCELRWRPR